MSGSDSPTYLVLCATGRQGKATIQSLSKLGVTSGIVGSSRNPESGSAKKLLTLDGVTKVVQADMNDVASLVSAIRDSKASRIWFTTDSNSIRWPNTRNKEAQTGRNVIDAIKECADQVEHVVYSSVGDADNCPESIQHFWAKADVEKYMKEELKSTTTTTITWSIIRPVAFFENLDDAATYNPLTKGKVKMLQKEECKVKFVATADIGKGSAALLVDPEKYQGKTIDAVGGEHTGTELAEALTKASGTPCTYAIAMPRFLMWLLVRDLYHMVNWFESGDSYTGEIASFKELVPDAMDATAWFVSKGQWADGEKFVAAGSSD
jgi:uncharacterized protein YbjT (DUF2867 family)